MFHCLPQDEERPEKKLIARARGLLSKGRPKEAAEVLQEALQRFPDNYYFMTMLAGIRHCPPYVSHLFGIPEFGWH